METNEYLASMAGLFFIFIVVWYLTSMNWIPGNLLTPIGQLLGLCAIVVTAIYVVSQIKG